MALPAGRYGVTKNQLLKIKKLPMNTIKLIEELTEKYDLLGTAAFKNSTSVVTDSTDLVESGAVENIIGWGNKNLDNPASISPSGGVTVTRTATGYNVSNPSSAIWSLARLYYANEPNTDYTLSLDASVISGISGLAIGGTNNLNTTPSSYVVDISNFSGHVEKTFNVGDFTYICVTLSVSRGTAVVGNINFDNYMLEKGSTATTYEPYHASVEQTMRDAQFIQGKNYLPNDITTQTVNGITFAVQEDGTVIATGTASADWARVYFANNTYLPVGNYLLSGVTGGATTTYRITLEMSDATSVTVFDGDTAFTITEGKYITKAAILIRQAGYVANNVVFKPMIRKATESDSTYEPYYIPLKDSKADTSVIGTVEDGTNPTKSYAVNEFMVRDRAFCQVTAPVTTSSTWTEGSNYTKKSIAEVLQSLMS